MELTDRLDMIRFYNGTYSTGVEETMHEYILSLCINGAYKKNLYCSPSEFKELAVGHAYTERFFTDIGRIESVFINEASGHADILFSKGEDTRALEEKQEFVSFSRDHLLEMLRGFHSEPAAPEMPAGIYRCALCDDSGILFSCADISCSNALDKVIGKALLNGDGQPYAWYLITNGCVNHELLKKAMRANIQMIVSFATVTCKAIDLARENGLALLGDSSPEGFNIYCGRDRLNP